MTEYYFDEDHGIAYKVDPVAASVVRGEGKNISRAILVHTDVKVTNIKKQKVRRTLSEMYPSDKYDLDSAKKVFSDTLLSKFISGAKKISKQEYEQIKARYEAQTQARCGE